MHQNYACFVIIGNLKMLDFVCNKCYDVLMTTYEVENIAILNVKCVNFRCVLCGFSRDKAVNRLNNSVLDDEGVL